MSSSPLIERLDNGQWLFWCPGCEGGHAVDDKWKMTGTPESPTLSPSVLSTFGETPGRCHLFVRSGQLQFLSDCTHALAGKTVPMERLPWSDDTPEDAPPAPRAGRSHAGH